MKLDRLHRLRTFGYLCRALFFATIRSEPFYLFKRRLLAVGGMLMLGPTTESCLLERQAADNNSSTTTDQTKGTDDILISGGTTGQESAGPEGMAGGGSESTPANECAGAGKIITDSTFNIMDDNLEKILFSSSAGAAAGAKVTAVSADDAKDGLWRFITDSPDTYRILHVQTGMVLGGSSQASLGPDDGSLDHKWRVSEPSDACLVTISNSHNSKRLSLADESGIVRLADPVGESNRLRLKRRGGGFPTPKAVTTDGIALNPSVTRSADGRLLLFHDDGKGNLLFQTGTDRQHFSNPQPVLKDPPATEMRFEPSVMIHKNIFWLAYYSVSATDKTSSPALTLARSETGQPGSFARTRDLQLNNRRGKSSGPLNPSIFALSDDEFTVSFSYDLGRVASISFSPAKGLFVGPTKSAEDPGLLANIILEGNTAAAGSLYRKDERLFLFFENHTLYDWPHYSGITKFLALPEPSSTSFVDRAGVRGLDGGGSIVLASHGAVLGPRHASVFDDQGETYLVYQFFDDSSQPRVGINKLAFVSNWPQIVD